MNTETKLEQARSHMTTVALGLHAVFGPMDAAGTCIGAGVAILVQAHGDEWTADYLRELAAELETDPNLYQGHA
jgi:hypothetical protein